MNSHRNRTGFTLIELMAVILIIVTLAAIVMGTADYAQRKMIRQRIRTEIAALETALETYKLDYGTYPLSTDVRSNSLTNNNLLFASLSRKSYIDLSKSQIETNISCTIIVGPPNVTNLLCTLTNIVDPYGLPYNYFRTNPPPAVQMNKMTFDLWSYGPDTLSSTPANQRDDITNWQ